MRRGREERGGRGEYEEIEKGEKEDKRETDLLCPVRVRGHEKSEDTVSRDVKQTSVAVVRPLLADC